MPRESRNEGNGNHQKHPLPCKQGRGHDPHPFPSTPSAG
jgi:hypothetical protein